MGRGRGDLVVHVERPVRVGAAFRERLGMAAHAPASVRRKGRGSRPRARRRPRRRVGQADDELRRGGLPLVHGGEERGGAGEQAAEAQVALVVGHEQQQHVERGQRGDRPQQRQLTSSSSAPPPPPPPPAPPAPVAPLAPQSGTVRPWPVRPLAGPAGTAHGSRLAMARSRGSCAARRSCESRRCEAPAAPGRGGKPRRRARRPARRRAPERGVALRHPPATRLEPPRTAAASRSWGRLDSTRRGAAAPRAAGGRGRGPAGYAVRLPADDRRLDEGRARAVLTASAQGEVGLGPGPGPGPGLWLGLGAEPGAGALKRSGPASWLTRTSAVTAVARAGPHSNCSETCESSPSATPAWLGPCAMETSASASASGWGEG